MPWIAIGVNLPLQKGDRPNKNGDPMIVEVRSYRIKPGRRADFVRLFEERTGPAQLELGMHIIGPLLDLEDSNLVVWLRSFPSADDRDRMKESFYEGPTWKEELESLVMPLLESYSAVVCEGSAGMFDGPLSGG